MSKEQYKGINVHDVVNDLEGLQCILYIGRFQTGSAIWKFFDVRGSILNSFLMSSVLEAEIFQLYGFLEEHKVCTNNHY